MAAVPRSGHHRRRRTPARPRALVLAAVLAAGALTRPAAWSGPWQPSVKQPHRPAAVARTAAPAAASAAPVTGAGTRTWQEAHADAKALNAQLQDLTARAERLVSKLDKMWVEGDLRGLPPVPPVPLKAPQSEAEEYGGRPRPAKRMLNDDGTPRPDSWRDFFDGELTKGIFEKPEGMKDLEEDPPILTFQASLKGQFVGKFSRSAEFQLPARVYPVQLTAGAGDDPSAGEEQNRLWRDSLDMTVDTLEQLWPVAEAAVGAVAGAEERAEARRPKPIEEWRQRVLEVLKVAHEDSGIDRSEINLEQCLETLQSDQRLVRTLSSLEDLVLEVEGCKNEMLTKTQEASKFAEDSDDYRRKMRRYQSLAERFQRAKVDVRTIAATAKELPETDAAFKELGDAIASLNPFR